MRSVWLISMLCLGLLAGCRGAATVETMAPARRAELALAEMRQGTRMLDEQDYGKAERHLARAVELDSFSGAARNNLGKCYFHQGRMYDAAWQFERTIQLLPNQPEAHNNLGLVLETTGRLDDAIVRYEQAIQLKPDDPQFIGNLARARLRRGDREPSLRDLLQRLLACETRPNWRAWAQQQLAQPDWPTTSPSEPKLTEQASGG